MENEPRTALPRLPYRTPRIEDLGSVRELTLSNQAPPQGPDGPNYPADNGS